MTIRFNCDCGQELQAHDEHAGRQTRCPTCGREVAIPNHQEGVQPAPAAPPPERQRDRSGGLEEWPESGSPAHRRAEGPPATSGKAVAAFVLGLLSLCLSIFAGIPAIILGILSLMNISRSEGRLKGQGLAITGIVLGAVGGLLLGPVLLIAMLVPAVQKVREAAGRVQSMNNLKEISLAMHLCNEQQGRLPAAAIYGPDGRPLLSWRVALLPYIEQDNPYKQFKLDEPWDSPHNMRLLTLMPKTYAHPAPKGGIQPGYTYYRVFTGPGTAFESTRGLNLDRDFPDSVSNTILVVEAADAVPWTKPDELSFGLG